MSKTVVVVGAGISGLLLARTLSDQGCQVVVLEKSRGVGGRLATKRVGAATFDQGAQFFTVRDERFASWVAGWRSRGLADGWPTASGDRVIGAGGMTAIPKALAEGLDVRREFRVAAARRDGTGEWVVEVEDQDVIRAGSLVLTAPVPQSQAILHAGGMALPSEVAAGLDRLSYHPCLALLLVLDGPSAVPVCGVRPDSKMIRWIADNTLKGVSPGPAGAVTVHTTPAFAERHYERGLEEVAALLGLEVAPFLGGSGISAMALHRWRFSEPRSTYADAFVWLDDLRLGVCGDAFGGPRVEGAAISGLALAGRMAEALKCG